MLLAALIGATTVLAVQTAGADGPGPPPVRVYREHVAVQDALRNGLVWTKLRQGKFAGWSVRFDERTGRPWTMWGPGIELGPIPDGPALDHALRDLMARHPELAGVPQTALALRQARHFPDGDSWVVHYDQVLAGSPHPQDPDLRAEASALRQLAPHDRTTVWRGTVTFDVKAGHLARVKVKTSPSAQRGPVLVSARAAVATVLAEKGRRQPGFTVEGAVLMVVPEEVGTGLEHRTAWVVRTVGRGQHVVPEHHYIDATTGEYFARDPELHALTGTLSVQHDDRIPGNLVVSPLHRVAIEGSDGGSVFTDADGAFSVTGDATAFLHYGWDGVLLHSEYGGTETLGTPIALTMTDTVLTDADAAQSLLSARLYYSEAMDWMHTYAPDSNLMGRLGIQVLVDTPHLECDARGYWNESGPAEINLGIEGPDCHNPARSKDVFFHEWGHGFLAERGGSYPADKDYAEGFADTFTFLATGDSEIAPGFLKSGDPLRDLEPDRRYPDDWDHVDWEASGLIFSGAMWDWWKVLAARDGEAEATAYMSQLLTRLGWRHIELVDAYDDVVSTDEDLDEGHSNYCDIVFAFGAHGLGPVGQVPGVSIDYARIENQPSVADAYPIEAEVVDRTRGCMGDVAPTTASVFWSTDGGSTFTETPLSISDLTLSGHIPHQPSGAVVHYYVSAQAGEHTLTAPLHGPRHPATFLVGPAEEVYCTDFEEGGDSLALWTRSPDRNANDWQCGAPEGKGGDPGYPWSGRICGNQLTRSGLYSDGEDDRFVSPPIPVPSDQPLVLQYRRWLTVVDGLYDQAAILIDGRLVWRNDGTDEATDDPTSPEYRNRATIDREWVLHTVPFEAAGDSVQVSFELNSGGTTHYGGWNIDDVCVLALPAPEPTDSGSPADLTGPTDSTSPTAQGSGSGTQKGGCSHGGYARASGHAIGLLGLVAVARRLRPEDEGVLNPELHPPDHAVRGR